MFLFSSIDEFLKGKEQVNALDENNLNIAKLITESYMYYHLSIGSNIDAEKSAVHIIRALCTEFGCIALFPFRYTEPEDIRSETPFLNSLAIVISKKDRLAVKECLNKIEIGMGRDRSDPLRSIKSRRADIDILGVHREPSMEFFREAKEGYVQSCFRLQGPSPSLEGLAAHERAASVYLDTLTGDIAVVEDELHRFIDG